MKKYKYIICYEGMRENNNLVIGIFGIESEEKKISEKVEFIRKKVRENERLKKLVLSNIVKL